MLIFSYTGHEIPDDATYIVVAERLMGEGHALFWATKVNEYKSTERYVLKRAFYYRYEHSLYEWLDQITGNSPFPLVEPHEEIRWNTCNSTRFLRLYSCITDAVDSEMNWRTSRGSQYFLWLKGRVARVRRGLIRDKNEVMALLKA